MNNLLRNSRTTLFAKLTSVLAMSTLAFNLSAQTVDIDEDDDGIVDSGAQSANLLQNSDFENGTENWVINDVEASSDAGPTDNPANNVIGEIGQANSASFYQDIALADIGLTNSTGLQAALASNAMQVEFGGWVNSIVDGSASIQLFFMDSDNNAISSISIPMANTFNWTQISDSAGIPAGTTSLRYSVTLADNGASTDPQVKLDDLYLNIRQDRDSDSDGIVNDRDIDLDNDGVVDSNASDKNVLKNADFQQSLTYWSRNDVETEEDSGRNTTPSNILVGEDGQAIESSFEQNISLADLGFSNSAELQAALTSKRMQAVFGGWVNSIVDGSATIQLFFIDSDNNPISNTRISQVNTFQWTEVSETTVIPAGTTSLTYSVTLADNGASADAQVQLDDVYLYLRQANDSDADGIENDIDIDSDNDGIADSSASDTNVLKNGDFQLSLTSWTRNDVETRVDAGRTDDSANILVGEDAQANSASIDQVIALSDIGFTDSGKLEDALNTNAMQVVFGGWVQSIVEGSATIQVFFQNSSGSDIATANIPLVNTSDWTHVTEATGIPSGTTAIRYSVTFLDNGSSTDLQVKVDDLYLYVRQANDSDSDGIENGTDIDSDNDGVADADLADVNILDNGDFQWGMAYWIRNDVFSLQDNGRNDDPENILVGEDAQANAASIYQTIELEDIGFTNSSALQEALTASAMQIFVSGWVNTGTGTENAISITLQFMNSEGSAISSIAISDASHSEWTNVTVDGVIPAGTVSLRLTANLVDSGSSRDAEIKLDDLALTIRNIADNDGDGLNNYVEEQLGTDPDVADTDGDGLNDGVEVNQSNTSPTNADSDGDGLSDGDEVNQHSTDPNAIDSDGDGITDGAEVTVYFSNPNSADTDSDGISDSVALRTGLAVNGKYHYIRPRMAWARAPINVVTIEWQVKSSSLVTGGDALNFGIAYDSSALTLVQTLNAVSMDEIATTSSESLTAHQQSFGHDTLVNVSVDSHTPGTEWTTVVTQHFDVSTDMLYGASTTVEVYNVDENIGEVLTQGNGAVVSLKPLSLDINADNDVSPLVDGFIFQRFMSADDPSEISAENLVQDGEEGNRSKEQILQMLKNAARESNE